MKKIMLLMLSIFLLGIISVASGQYGYSDPEMIKRAGDASVQSKGNYPDPATVRGDSSSGPKVPKGKALPGYKYPSNQMKKSPQDPKTVNKKTKDKTPPKKKQPKKQPPKGKKGTKR